jgi:hypothetical protein
MNMTARATHLLYGIAGAYAVLTLIARETGIIFISVIGFGLPVLAFLAMEWLAPPLIAVFVGLQARWSLTKALYGAPLVILYTIITPFVHGKNVVLPANVPWLAAFPGSTAEAVSVIQQRIVWWGGAFLVTLILARISRIFRPLQQAQDAPKVLRSTDTVQDQSPNREPKK